MASKILWNNMKLAKGKALVETVATGVTEYPASGSFIDVSGFEYFHVLVHLGTINTGDAMTLEPRCSDAANGTMDQISATLVHSPDKDADDGEWVVWTIAVENLPLNHHFVALQMGGTYSNTSYLDVVFLLDGAREMPVTQTAAALPAGSRYSWVG